MPPLQRRRREVPARPAAFGGTWQQLPESTSRARGVSRSDCMVGPMLAWWAPGSSGDIVTRRCVQPIDRLEGVDAEQHGPDGRVDGVLGEGVLQVGDDRLLRDRIKQY